jgi:hypothetical protein
MRRRYYPSDTTAAEWALIGLVGLRRTGVVLAKMSQRRVADVLDVVPADLGKALWLLCSCRRGWPVGCWTG